MQIAFRTHDLGVKGLQNAIQKARNCGISAVPLVAYKFMDEIKYAPNQLNAENAAAIGAALKQSGISVPLIGAYFNPVHSDKSRVANGIAVFKEYLRYCTALGCNIVGSETGSFNDDKWTYNPLNRTEQALQTVIPHMQSSTAHMSVWCARRVKSVGTLQRSNAQSTQSTPTISELFSIYTTILTLPTIKAIFKFWTRA